MKRFSEIPILKFVFMIFASANILLSCSGDDEKKEKIPSEKDYLFSKLESETTGINFINSVKNKEDFNIFRYRNFYNGAGVGIGDINNDNLPDVYLTSNMGENKLYLNQGNFKFKDITATSGTGGKKSWSTGVTLVDINNDGYLDIYVSNAGAIEGNDRANELFINNGDLTFTEAAANYNLDENGFTTHAAFFDYDGDGDLDVYILNNSFIPVTSLGYTNKRDLRSDDWDLPEIFKGGGDKLLRNNNGIFEDLSDEAGIYGSLIGFGLGVTLGDVNHDLLPDIYVSNDFYERDYLYINQGDGTFREDIKNRINHLSLSSMGADMADINNDGFPEIFVTDMLPEEDERLKNVSEFERYDLYKLKEEKDFYHQYMQNSLQLNNADNTFSEIAFYSGVAQTDWSWGALIFDMNNDGFKDIFVSNGIYYDLTNQDFMDFFANEILQEMVLTGKKKEFDSILNQMPSTPIPNYAFKNNGNLTFTNKAEDWGFSTPSFSNGSAYGDLDNDGDLDLIVNNVNQEVFVYRNNTENDTENNYLKVELKGAGENNYAIGSKVNVFLKNKTLYQELFPSRGFQSSVDYNLIFGLGEAKNIDSVQVIWPNKKVSVLKDLKPNQTITLEQEEATKDFVLPLSEPNSLFTEVKTLLEPHKENNYIDFDYEGLIYQMLSREGPAIAVGDINKDGLQDVFLGGATYQEGKIYLQSSRGDFKPVSNEVFTTDKNFEDTDAVFEDINGDGAPDLVVASGGNNIHSDKGSFRTRIYLNKGGGKFEASPFEIPSTDHNLSVIATNDFDNDGDTDLFIGSRSVPGTYGINPKHLLLENDGKGKFKNVTEAKAYELNDLGMITDATWADMDGDNIEDLVVTGDWIAPRIFITGKNGLEPLQTNLDTISGAWKDVEASDLNNDGTIDLVLGNRGINSFYNTSEQNPVKVYINDFDNNGTIEQIFTRSIKGKDVPVHLRRELSSQIASVKKQNLKFSDYAKRSIDQLFSEEVIANSLVKEIKTFHSIIAYNDGNGNFTIEELPAEVQFSTVNEIQIIETGEEKLIVLAGNNIYLKPQYGRMDSNQGIILVKDEKGKFRVRKSANSGLNIDGQVNALKTITNKNGEIFIIAGINDAAPKIFKFRNENL